MHVRKRPVDEVALPPLSHQSIIATPSRIAIPQFADWKADTAMTRTRHSLSVPAILRTAFGLGLIAYLTLSGSMDWSALRLLLVNWKSAGLALALLCLVSVLVSVRLTFLLVAQGLRMPLLTAFRLVLIGGFFSAFLPGAAGGDVARMYFAARTNPGRGTELVTVIAVDRFVGLLSLLALPILVAFGFKSSVASGSFIVLRGLLVLSTIGFVLGILAILACWFGPLRPLVISLLGRIQLSAHARRLFQTLDGYRSRQGTLVGAFVLSLLIQAIAVGAVLLLVRATGGSPITSAMILVIPFGQLANALPVTPGGLGVGEAAFAGLFASVGATGGAEALLAWRVLTSLLDLAGGAILVAGNLDMSLARAGGATHESSAPGLGHSVEAREAENVAE